MIDNEEKVKYGLKLKEYRERLNLTQEEVVNRAKKFIEESYNDCESLENKICFTQNQLSNWEKGKYIPHHINRFLLSVVYKIPAEDLEFNYPKNIETELMNYLNELKEEDNTYIEKDGILYESEEEMKELVQENFDEESKEAFINGTKVNIYKLVQLHLNKNWDIKKKTQFIIDLHIAQGLTIPKILMDIINEDDSDKALQMYYKYYMNFYNGSLYASKKKNKSI